MDYKTFNLNARLMDMDSPLVKEHGRRNEALELRNYPKLDIRRIKTSTTAFSNIIQISNPGTATGGPFDPGDSVKISIFLTPGNTFSDSKLLAMPEVSIYQGTAAVGSMQIYPYAGSGVSGTAWSFHADFDYTLSDNKKANYFVIANNDSAGTHNIYALAQYRYIQEHSGTARATQS